MLQLVVEEELSFAAPEGFKRVDNLHISLSRWNEFSNTEIKAAVKWFEEEFELIDPIVVIFDISKPCLLKSEDSAKVYLAVEVLGTPFEGKDKVIVLIRKYDNFLRGLGKRTFFKDARPHVSFAWTDNTSCSKLLNIKAKHKTKFIKIEICKTVLIIGGKTYYKHLRKP
eukprot:snap_masked-scaffold_18-processed-gene-6.45-mRNA-1 protein AED:1.00 eAED:1.00 QI:0/-1/0/0/-1/1/1/0/168